MTNFNLFFANVQKVDKIKPFGDGKNRGMHGLHRKMLWLDTEEQTNCSKAI